MAQLRQPPPSNEIPFPAYIALTWQEFVYHVLELTIKAYQAMRQDGIAKLEWEENVFSIRFGYDYIRPTAFDLNSPIRVTVRTKTHTSNMMAGRQATIEATEVDLLMFDVWEIDYHTKHFVWEAKRVGDKRSIKKYSRLNSEYVNEAIYRFIRKDYAEGLSDAGILAYVLAGSTTDIANDINRAMGTIRKNPPLPKSSHLRTMQPVAGHPDIYCSEHLRIDSTVIKLHHVFLSFF